MFQFAPHWIINQLYNTTITTTNNNNNNNKYNNERRLLVVSDGLLYTCVSTNSTVLIL